MHTITRLVSLFTLSLCTAVLSVQASVPADSSQLLVTITDDWDAPTGYLYTFVRDESGWQRQPLETPVNIGRSGLAWGIGLHEVQAGIQKREGDGKAPAGIFYLGDAFGYLPEVATGMSYQPMDATDFCIDVPGSPYYNQTVDAQEVGEAAVQGSSEGMRRDIHYGDQQYRKGLFVQHNPENIDGAGSCIFIHLWKKHGAPTAGCTAFAEPTLDRLLVWLDRKAKPVYVALPRSEYVAKRAQWGLPEIEQ